MKQCTKCKEIKSLSEFYSNKNMLGGKESRCKNCKRDYDREYNEANRKRRNRVALAYYYSNREEVRQYQRERRKKEPLKYKAVDKLKVMTRSGRIIRPDNCSKCGRECVPDGHHEDYSKPLEVVWLCKPCHKELHHDKILAQRQHTKYITV